RDYKVTGVQTCALPILQTGMAGVSGAGTLLHLSASLRAALSHLPVHDLQAGVAGISSAGALLHLSARVRAALSHLPVHDLQAGRSEERRVGKERKDRRR